MFDLSWSVALIGASLLAAGYALLELSKWLTRTTKTSTARAVLVWPCRALGGALFTASVLIMIWNVVGPIATWLARP